MALSFDEELATNKRLLEYELKKPTANRAEIMMALKAVEEQQKLGEDGVRNAMAMRDSQGREILYVLLKKNRILAFFRNIRKKVFELVYTRFIKSK